MPIFCAGIPETTEQTTVKKTLDSSNCFHEIILDLALIG